MKEACTVWWTVFSKYGQRKTESACYLSRETGRYPTGWTSPVVAALRKADIQYYLVDLRKNDKKSYRLGKTTMHLRDYQEKGSEAALVKSRGIISHATGSGKTVTAAVTIQKIGRKTIYFVPNRTLLEQTAKDLAEVIPAECIGKCGGKHWEPLKPVVVCTAQMIWARKDTPEVKKLLSETGCIVIDECHHVAKSPSAKGNTWYSLVMRSGCILPDRVHSHAGEGSRSKAPRSCYRESDLGGGHRRIGR